MKKLYLLTALLCATAVNVFAMDSDDEDAMNTQQTNSNMPARPNLNSSFMQAQLERRRAQTDRENILRRTTRGPLNINSHSTRKLQDRFMKTHLDFLSTDLDYGLDINNAPDTNSNNNNQPPASNMNNRVATRGSDTEDDDQTFKTHDDFYNGITNHVNTNNLYSARQTLSKWVKSCLIRPTDLDVHNNVARIEQTYSTLKDSTLGGVDKTQKSSSAFERIAQNIASLKELARGSQR